MRRAAALALFLSACAHGRRPLTVAVPADATLDHDRAFVCAYQASANRLACVTPEEYAIRHGMDAR